MQIQGKPITKEERELILQTRIDSGIILTDGKIQEILQSDFEPLDGEIDIIKEARRAYKIKRASLLVCMLQNSLEILEELKNTNVYRNDLKVSLKDSEGRMIKWLDRNMYLNEHTKLTGVEIEDSLSFIERIRNLFESQYEVAELLGPDPEKINAYKADYAKLIKKHLS